MSTAEDSRPLRILLACARPLVLKKEHWELELREPAPSHGKAAEAELRGIADIGPIWTDGRTLRFDLYPPRPSEELLRDRLAARIPLVRLGHTSEPLPLYVNRAGTELEAIRKGLEGQTGVELYVHPAATPADLLKLLQANEIDVLHFSGHGDNLGGLYFEDGRGSARRLPPRELADLVGGRIKLLITAACYSARALSQLYPRDAEPDGVGALPAAIAVDDALPIPVHATALFAEFFYASLARGRDIGWSFDAAIEAVRADDLVGERSLPDGAHGMPSPWNRFRHYGDMSLAWPVDPNRDSKVTFLVAPSPHHKLPRADDLFVGRNVEIAGTVEALEPGAGMTVHKPRVVTIHREGGIGKTRLAEAVADWLEERGAFPGGIVEVDCEPARDAVGLAVAILGRLGSDRPESLPDPIETLEERLRSDSAPRLLVLDNLDALFARNGDGGTDLPSDSAGSHPGRLLKRCLAASPSLRVLATSRWPLNLGGDENPFDLEPLDHESAASLFVLSVRDQDLRRALQAEDPDQRIARLAPLLVATERMPLALVLAAGRLTDPGEGLSSLILRASTDLLELCRDERLSHLRPRLRSVRASLELSYRRLSEPAKVLFSRMSFFPGGLSRAFDPSAICSARTGASSSRRWPAAPWPATTGTGIFTRCFTRCCSSPRRNWRAARATPSAYVPCGSGGTSHPRSSPCFRRRDWAPRRCPPWSCRRPLRRAAQSWS